MKSEPQGEVNQGVHHTLACRGEGPKAEGGLPGREGI